MVTESIEAAVPELPINIAGILGEFHRILVELGCLFRIPEEFSKNPGESTGFCINSYTSFFAGISKIKGDN